MTVRIGRRRFTLSLTVAVDPGSKLVPLLGADDAELARLSRNPAYDVEIARLTGMAIVYGASPPRQSRSMSARRAL
ncbi:MAG: hypothetical protein IT337_02850 [Thermomicrobiales bacterium]|nr:hypothetical protein [Thermomicrobiales bacterium]